MPVTASAPSNTLADKGIKVRRSRILRPSGFIEAAQKDMKPPSLIRTSTAETPEESPCPHRHGNAVDVPGNRGHIAQPVIAHAQSHYAYYLAHCQYPRSGNIFLTPRYYVVRRF